MLRYGVSVSRSARMRQSVLHTDGHPATSKTREPVPRARRRMNRFSSAAAERAASRSRRPRAPNAVRRIGRIASSGERGGAAGGSDDVPVARRRPGSRGRLLDPVPLKALRVLARCALRTHEGAASTHPGTHQPGRRWGKLPVLSWFSVILRPPSPPACCREATLRRFVRTGPACRLPARARSISPAPASPAGAAAFIPSGVRISRRNTPRDTQFVAVRQGGPSSPPDRHWRTRFVSAGPDGSACRQAFHERKKGGSWWVKRSEQCCWGWWCR